jgi:hypothetical protein
MTESSTDAAEDLMPLSYGQQTKILEANLDELGKTHDSIVAAKYRVSVNTVYAVRKAHGIPSNRKRNAWTDEEVALLGKFSDAAVAKMTGRNRPGVRAERLNRRIPGIDPHDALRLHKVSTASAEASTR